ncbi:MAG: hypothetical protein ACJA2S_001573 [Cyclobacteriaceae bacterium]|jgi:hypothetical protein
MFKNFHTTLFLFLLFFSTLFGCSQNKRATESVSSVIEWLPAKLLHQSSSNVQIRSNPKEVDSPYGKALHFDGIDDAIYLEEMPLKSLKEFTVEMIFFPDSSSLFEQRILHIGDVTENRMLLEIRVVEDNWYFDGFTATGDSGKALIDEGLLHPVGQWYHVAFVVGPESLTTFVNGKKELSETYSFNLIESGRTSIGVRQNEHSWFEGSIFKIKITPEQLSPDEFMDFESFELLASPKV